MRNREKSHVEPDLVPIKREYLRLLVIIKFHMLTDAMTFTWAKQIYSWLVERNFIMLAQLNGPTKKFISMPVL